MEGQDRVLEPSEATLAIRGEDRRELAERGALLRKVHRAPTLLLSQHRKDPCGGGCFDDLHEGPLYTFENEEVGSCRGLEGGEEGKGLGLGPGGRGRRRGGGGNSPRPEGKEDGSPSKEQAGRSKLYIPRRQVYFHEAPTSPI